MVAVIPWYTAMGCEETDRECLSRWDQVHIAAIPPSYISLCCSIYIIIMTLVYIKQFRTITFGATLPMYISICDAVFHSCHGSDHVHNLITSYISPGGWCLFLGSMKQWSINSQTSWAIATAYFINYCIRNGSPPDKKYTKFNIILHSICWGIPTLVTIFGFIFNVYGLEGPWCGIRSAWNDFLMVDLWVLVADVVLIILYGWTYYIIYYKMKQANLHIRTVSSNIRSESIRTIRSQSSVDCGNVRNDVINARVDKSAKSITKVMKTLPWFPIVFVCQWTLFLMWKLVLAQTWPQTMATVIITNMGGMFNVIVFYRLLMNPVNKKKRERKKLMMQMEMGKKPCNGHESHDNGTKTISTNELDVESPEENTSTVESPEETNDNDTMTVSVQQDLSQIGQDYSQEIP